MRLSTLVIRFWSSRLYTREYLISFRCTLLLSVTQTGLSSIQWRYTHVPDFTL